MSGKEILDSSLEWIRLAVWREMMMKPRFVCPQSKTDYRVDLVTKTYEKKKQNQDANNKENLFILSNY